MTVGYTEIILGTQSLILTSLSRRKVPATIKQKLGGKLIRNATPFRNDMEWEIQASGVIVESASTTAPQKRAILEEYNDIIKRQYQDGLVTGSFIISDLSFTDEDNAPLHYQYKISLIEYNQ